MSAIINYPLSKAAATALFKENAILYYNADAIPVHRIVELFGEPAARYLDKVTHYGSSFEAGRDWNAAGACGDDPCLPFYYLSGFFKIVSEHNHRLQVIAHQSSEGGQIYDKVWEERYAALRAADEEEERKRQERKAKRAAAKAEREARA